MEKHIIIHSCDVLKIFRNNLAPFNLQIIIYALLFSQEIYILSGVTIVVSGFNIVPNIEMHRLLSVARMLRLSLGTPNYTC